MCANITALHDAARYLQTAVMRLLLEKDANMHAVTKQAEAALHSVFTTPITDSHLRDSKNLISMITVLLAHGQLLCRKTAAVKPHPTWQKRIDIPKPKGSFYGISRNTTSNRHNRRPR